MCYNKIQEQSHHKLEKAKAIALAFLFYFKKKKIQKNETLCCKKIPTRSTFLFNRKIRGNNFYCDYVARTDFFAN